MVAAKRKKTVLKKARKKQTQVFKMVDKLNSLPASFFALPLFFKHSSKNRTSLLKPIAAKKKKKDRPFCFGFSPVHQF